MFRPSFTLALVYLVALFFLYAFLLIMPELMTVLRDVQPGPEQQAIAEQAARESFRSKFPWAFALALATLGIGGWLQVLPGLSRRS